MVMIDHAGKLGPLHQTMVKNEAKIGSETCSMEEIILNKAKTFSRGGGNLRISAIGSAAYGSSTIRRSISDFYPNLAVPDKNAGVSDQAKQSISNPLPKTPVSGKKRQLPQSWDMSLCADLRFPSDLTWLPGRIAELVVMPVFADATDPSIPICEKLDTMHERVAPSRESVLAIALLWIYVGVLENRRKKYDPVRVITGVDARLGGLFKIAVARDKYEVNIMYIIFVHAKKDKDFCTVHVGFIVRKSKFTCCLTGYKRNYNFLRNGLIREKEEKL